jgi:hypothetical protein
MSLRHLKRLFDAEPTWRNQAEFAMLLTIAYLTNDERGYAWPSRTYLAKRLRLEPRSVTRIIRELEGRGLIQVFERGTGKRPSRYRLLFPRGDAAVTSDAFEVTGESDGGDTADLRNDRGVTSEVTPATPNQYVPGSDQERPGAAAPRVPSLSEEEDRALRLSLLNRTAANIGIRRTA